MNRQCSDCGQTLPERGWSLARLRSCCFQNVKSRDNTERGLAGIPPSVGPVGKRLTEEIHKNYMPLWQLQCLRALAADGFHRRGQIFTTRVTLKSVSSVTVPVEYFGDWIEATLLVQLNEQSFNVDVPLVPVAKRGVLNFWTHAEQLFSYLGTPHHPQGVILSKQTIVSEEVDALFLPKEAFRRVLIRELRASWEETLVVYDVSDEAYVCHWSRPEHRQHQMEAEKGQVGLFPARKFDELFCSLLGLNGVEDHLDALERSHERAKAAHGGANFSDSCDLCKTPLEKDSLEERVCRMMRFEDETLAQDGCLLRHRGARCLLAMQHRRPEVCFTDPPSPKMSHLGSWLMSLVFQHFPELVRLLEAQKKNMPQSQLVELVRGFFLRSTAKKLNQAPDEENSRAGVPTRQPSFNANASVCFIQESQIRLQNRLRDGFGCHSSLDFHDRAPLACSSCFSPQWSLKQLSCFRDLLRLVTLQSGAALQFLGSLSGAVEIQLNGVPCYSLGQSGHMRSHTLACQLFLSLNKLCRSTTKLNEVTGAGSEVSDEQLRLMVAFLGVRIEDNVINFLLTPSRLVTAYWITTPTHPSPPVTSFETFEGESLERAARAQLAFLDDNSLQMLKQGSAHVQDGEDMEGRRQLQARLQKEELDLVFLVLVPRTITDSTLLVGDAGRRTDGVVTKYSVKGRVESASFDKAWAVKRTSPMAAVFFPGEPQKAAPCVAGVPEIEPGKTCLHPAALDVFGSGQQYMAQEIRVGRISPRHDLDLAIQKPPPSMQNITVNVMKLVEDCRLNGLLKAGASPVLHSGAVIAFVKQPSEAQKHKQEIVKLRVKGQHRVVLSGNVEKKFMLTVLKANHQMPGRPRGNPGITKGLVCASKSMHHAVACLDHFCNLGHGASMTINLASLAARCCDLRGVIAAVLMSKGFSVYLFSLLPPEVQGQISMYFQSLHLLHTNFVAVDKFGRHVTETTSLLSQYKRDPKAKEHHEGAQYRLETYPGHATLLHDLDGGLMPVSRGWTLLRHFVQQRLFAQMGLHVEIPTFPKKLLFRLFPVTMHQHRQPLWCPATSPEKEPLSQLFQIKTRKRGPRLEVLLESKGQAWLNLLLVADNNKASTLASTPLYACKRWTNFRAHPGPKFFGLMARELRKLALGLLKTLGHSEELLALEDQTLAEAQAALRQAQEEYLKYQNEPACDFWLQESHAGFRISAAEGSRLLKRFMAVIDHFFKPPGVVAAKEHFLTTLRQTGDTYATSGFVLNPEASLSPTTWHFLSLHEHSHCYGQLFPRQDGSWPEGVIQLLVVPAQDTEAVADAEVRVTRRWPLKKAWLLEPLTKDLVGFSYQEILHLAKTWLDSQTENDMVKAWEVDGNGDLHVESLSLEMAERHQAQPLLLTVTVGAASGKALSIKPCGENVVCVNPENVQKIRLQAERYGLPSSSGQRLLEHLVTKCPHGVLDELDIEDLNLTPKRQAACTGCGNCVRDFCILSLRSLHADPEVWKDALERGKIDYQSTGVVPTLSRDLSELRPLSKLVSLQKRSADIDSYVISQAEQHRELSISELKGRLSAAALIGLLVARNWDDLQAQINTQLN